MNSNVLSNVSSFHGNTAADVIPLNVTNDGINSLRSRLNPATVHEGGVGGTENVASSLHGVDSSKLYSYGPHLATNSNGSSALAVSRL